MAKDTINETQRKRMIIGAICVGVALFLSGIAVTLGYQSFIAHVERNGVNKYLHETK